MTTDTPKQPQASPMKKYAFKEAKPPDTLEKARELAYAIEEKMYVVDSDCREEPEACIDHAILVNLIAAALAEARSTHPPDEWYERSHKNHMEFVKRAQAKGRLIDDAEICRFLALAQAGEAGELANLFKKEWRGDELPMDKVKAEIADVYIYLKHLCWHLKIDIDEAASKKVDVVTDRLTAAPKPPTEGGV